MSLPGGNHLPVDSLQHVLRGRLPLQLSLHQVRILPGHVQLRNYLGARSRLPGRLEIALALAADCERVTVDS